MEALTPQESLLREVILQHYRASRHRGELASAASAEAVNPICGDVVRLHLRWEGDVIESARFTGQGCTVSQAAASMTAQLIEGLTLEQARSARERFARLLRGEPEDTSDLGDLRALAGVGRHPGRVRCALLVWDAFDSIAAEVTNPPK